MDITEEAISYGHGDLGRIYERLRKRSARSHSRHGDGRFDRWGDVIVTEPSWVTDTNVVWDSADHASYVAGVKAALAAVQEIA